MEIPFPAALEPRWISCPPLVAGDFVLVSIGSNVRDGTFWRVGLAGSDPRQVGPVSGPIEIADPCVMSLSPDGCYANVVSMSRMSVLEPEGTYFILDLVSGELVPLVFWAW